MFLFDPFGVEQFDGRMISIQIKSLRDCVFAKYRFQFLAQLHKMGPDDIQ